MLIFATQQPKALLSKFRKLIDEKHVETWSYDETGDFTHTPDQWRFRAWMRPYVIDNGLVFGIVSRRDAPLKVPTYGIYHGRLMESFCNHCDSMYSNCVSSALLDPAYDVIDGDIQPTIVPLLPAY